MKSLHLVKTSVGATWAYRVMRDLVALGDEVHVAIPTDGPMIQLYKDAGVQVHQLDFSVKNALTSMRGIRQLVNELKPDVVHSHFVLTTLLMRIALRKNPVQRIFEVPGPLHLEHFFFRNIELLMAQRQKDYWIPTCKWSLDKYRECGIDAERLTLTYYGNDFVERDYTSGVLRKELGLTSNEIIVGMVAYMYAPKRYLGEKRGLKGHEDLIDAVALLQSKYPNLHLVFVGGAWNGATKYEQQVMDYGKSKCRNIHFLGTRNDVPSLYKDFTLVVHPSHSENLGGAAESLCMGIPTIATNVGGFPDIVKDDITGYLVPPSDPDALAVAIEKMICNPEKANKMALEGKKFASALLDSKRTSKAVFDFYRLIVEKKK